MQRIALKRKILSVWRQLWSNDYWNHLATNVLTFHPFCSSMYWTYICFLNCQKVLTSYLFPIFPFVILRKLKVERGQDNETSLNVLSRIKEFLVSIFKQKEGEKELHKNYMMLTSYWCWENVLCCGLGNHQAHTPCMNTYEHLRHESLKLMPHSCVFFFFSPAPRLRLSTWKTAKVETLRKLCLRDTFVHKNHGECHDCEVWEWEVKYRNSITNKKHWLASSGKTMLSLFHVTM